MIDPFLLTTREAASQAQVRPGTIRQWAYTGRLTAKEHDQRGRPLYDIADVLRAERDSRVNATRRGGRRRSQPKL